MSKAAELAALIGSQSALSNRNLIINGAMQVAQRGTSETGVTGSEYANAPDRFKAQVTSAGTWTLSQSSTAPSGFANSYKWDCTTADASLAAGDVIQFAHKVEAQNLQQLQYGNSDAQAITVSFYVRSNKTGIYILEIFQEDSSRSISKSYTIDSANTWERKTITIQGDSSGTINDDNGTGFDMLWYLAAGSNFTSGTLATDWASIVSANRAVGQVNLADSTSNEWYITGIQLELGEQATPFEHRSFGDEYNRCLRYTYVPRNDSTDAGDGTTIATGYCQTGPIGVYFTEFPVPMRDIPSLTTTSTASSIEQAYHNASATSHNVSDMTYVASISGNQKACFTVASASFSGGEGAHLRYSTGNIADNIIVFSAEL